VPASPDPAVLAMLAAGEIDIVTFTSSSTVTNLLAQVRNAERGPGTRLRVESAEQGTDLLGGALVACIGPITAQTAREHGLRVDLVAEEHSIPGLVVALAEWAQGRDQGRFDSRRGTYRQLRGWTAGYEMREFWTGQDDMVAREQVIEAMQAAGFALGQFDLVSHTNPEEPGTVVFTIELRACPPIVVEPRISALIEQGISVVRWLRNGAVDEYHLVYHGKGRAYLSQGGS
jgi:hypothetical protein